MSERCNSREAVVGARCELEAGHAGPHRKWASDGSFVKHWQTVDFPLNYAADGAAMARAAAAHLRSRGPEKTRTTPGGAIRQRPSTAQLRRRLSHPDRSVRMEAWDFLRYRRERGIR